MAGRTLAPFWLLSVLSVYFLPSTLLLPEQVWVQLKENTVFYSIYKYSWWHNVIAVDANNDFYFTFLTSAQAPGSDWRNDPAPTTPGPNDTLPWVYLVWYECGWEKQTSHPMLRAWAKPSCGHPVKGVTQPICMWRRPWLSLGAGAAAQDNEAPSTAAGPSGLQPDPHRGYWGSSRGKNCQRRWVQPSWHGCTILATVNQGINGVMTRLVCTSYPYETGFNWEKSEQSRRLGRQLLSWNRDVTGV